MLFRDITPSTAEKPLQTDISEVNIMEELNVSQWLVFKKPEEDGPLVRGGRADALVVHATNAVKNGKHLKLKLKIKILKSYNSFKKS